MALTPFLQVSSSGDRKVYHILYIINHVKSKTADEAGACGGYVPCGDRHGVPATGMYA